MLFLREDKSMSVFKGAAVAIVTPFLDDQSVDYDQFAKNIEEQIAGNTDAIVVCGTTGEAATLSQKEHLDAIEFCVKQVNGRIPVIAGTGSNCTEEGIYMSTEAEKRGVDALLLVTPYYNKCTQKGLYIHFKAIADSVKIPCILYNVPSRTGVNILPETAVKLCKEVENIVGIKEASGNISQISRLMSLANGCVDLYSGDDNQIVPVLALGGIGVISVLSNIAPKQTHQICQDFFDGNVEASRELQLKAIPLIDALFCEVNPIPVKKAMVYLGKCKEIYRSPLCEMEEAHAELLKKEMENFGIL